MLEGFENYLNSGEQRLDPWVRAGLPQARQMQDTAGHLRSGSIRFQASDAAIAGGQAFLEAELEKRDPKVYEPLTSVTWMRDMPVDSGGGFVEFTSNYFVNYGISGPNMYGLMAGDTTSIPIIQADTTKDIFRVFNWGNIMRVPFIDMQKSQQIGRSLDDMYDKGIKLNWNKTLDQQSYLGPIPGSTTYPGLINNSAVTAASVATGASGKTFWSAKTPLEILGDINAVMIATWVASNYDVTGMANRILIPAAQFGILVTQPVTLAGSVSVLTYLLENNIGKSQGVDLKIFPSRWCSGAGAAGTDRMVAYVAEKDRLVLDVTVPIQRVMTVPTVQGGGAYETLYVGQIGQVKFRYLQPIQYADGI